MGKLSSSSKQTHTHTRFTGGKFKARPDRWWWWWWIIFSRMCTKPSIVFNGQVDAYSNASTMPRFQLLKPQSARSQFWPRNCPGKKCTSRTKIKRRKWNSGGEMAFFISRARVSVKQHNCIVLSQYSRANSICNCSLYYTANNNEQQSTERAFTALKYFFILRLTLPILLNSIQPV